LSTRAGFPPALRQCGSRPLARCCRSRTVVSSRYRSLNVCTMRLCQPIARSARLRPAPWYADQPGDQYLFTSVVAPQPKQGAHHDRVKMPAANGPSWSGMSRPSVARVYHDWWPGHAMTVAPPTGRWRRNPLDGAQPDNLWQDESVTTTPSRASTSLQDSECQRCAYGCC
jgi:hypothetical protein